MKKQRGFSLIEVLMGLIFLAIGLLALAGLQVTSVRGNFFSNNLMQATYIAQDRLEYLKSLDITSSKLQDGNHDDNPATVTVQGVVYNRRYEVVTNGSLRKISYIVSWNDGVGHQITFTTIRSQ